MSDDEMVHGPAGSTGSSPRWWVLAIAGGVAALMAWLAPTGWAEGPATLVVSVDGVEAMQIPVEIGVLEGIERGGDDGSLTVALPAGVPQTGSVHVDVELAGRSDVSVADVSVELVLADGSVEPIPSVAADDGTVRASRRPPADAAVVMGLLGAVIVLWITELVPLFVTSLAIPVVLAVSEAASAGDALAPFFDPIIVLFFAGFILAEAMHRVQLDDWAAASLVALAGSSPVRLYATMLATAAFLSMWMSNTAAVATLIPVALVVTAPFEELGYRKATILGIAYAATIGGVGSAIGTPANQLAIRFVRELTGRRISFAEWFGFGLPMVVLMLPLMGAYLWWRSDVRVSADGFAQARQRALEQRARMGGFSRHQLEVLVVFAAVAALWLTQTWHGVSTAIVALGGAVVLFAIGRALPEDLGRISWSTLLTFGGGLTLGVTMVDSGTADWLVTRLGSIAAPTLVVVTIVAAMSLLVTTVASNTAAAAMLIPLAVPMAGLVGVDPVLLVVVVAIASSVDFALVIGTPPTMLAYSTRLFTPAEILRKGLPLDLLGVFVLVIGVTPVWWLLGLV